MRVGIACFGYGLGKTGGVQVYLRELLRALERYDSSGHEYVLILHEGDEMPYVNGSKRFTLARLDPDETERAPWRRAVAGVFGGDARIDALDLDVVHYPATRVPRPAGRTPVALTFFDMQEEFLPGFFTLRERVARAALHRRGVHSASVVIAPSRFTASCLESRYGTPSAKIEHVPVGFGERFGRMAQPGEEQRLAQRYGLAPGGFVLYPANPWPHKNHERLFRALLRTAGNGHAPPLVCTGHVEGEPRTAQALAEAAGLPEGRVRDLGFVPEGDMPALFRAARFMIFPSLFEGFGIPVVEAMASGCPVACSALQPLSEIGGDAVRYFDPHDENAIAAAVDELWTDGSLRADLAARGSERAENYRWETLVPAIVSAYERAAAARQPRVHAHSRT